MESKGMMNWLWKCICCQRQDNVKMPQLAELKDMHKGICKEQSQGDQLYTFRKDNEMFTSNSPRNVFQRDSQADGAQERHLGFRSERNPRYDDSLQREDSDNAVNPPYKKQNTDVEKVLRVQDVMSSLRSLRKKSSMYTDKATEKAIRDSVKTFKHPRGINVRLQTEKIQEQAEYCDSDFFLAAQEDRLGQTTFASMVEQNMRKKRHAVSCHNNSAKEPPSDAKFEEENERPDQFNNFFNDAERSPIQKQRYPPPKSDQKSRLKKFSSSLIQIQSICDTISIKEREDLDKNFVTPDGFDECNAPIQTSSDENPEDAALSNQGDRLNHQMVARVDPVDNLENTVLEPQGLPNFGNEGEDCLPRIARQDHIRTENKIQEIKTQRHINQQMARLLDQDSNDF